jgi:transcriptional regulator with XRE-family HTH domain
MPLSPPNPKVRAKLKATGAAIQAARLAAGLTQDRLARAAGVSLGTVRKVEQGKRRPGPALAARLVEVLGVAIETDCPCCGRPW